jgi:hypothetical protein
MNYNLRIALTKIKGAKVMEIEGKTCKRKCVVIPIDSEDGTVVDSIDGKTHDGLTTTKFLNDVYLNLTAFEFREKKFGNSHGIKASFSRERMQSMGEDELKQMPFIGNMKPWATRNDDDDLPAGNSEDW